MICRVCGEEWALDSIHEAIEEFYPEHKNACRTPEGKWLQKEYEESYFNPMMARFRKMGCKAIDPLAHYCVPLNTPQTQAVIDAIADLSGDDVDAQESFLEDARMMGLL